MKAAMLSDLIVMKDKLVRITACWMLITFVTSVIAGNTPLVVIYVAIVNPIMTCSALFLTESASGWEGPRLALPLSRKNVVDGRYAALAAVTAASVATGALAYAAGCLATSIFPGLALLREAASFDFASLALCCASAVAFAAFALGVMMPLNLRFGYEGALKYAPAIFVLALALIPQALGPSGLNLLAIGAPALEGSSSQILLLSASLVALGATWYVGSASVAAQLYERRSF
ncbi:MAG: hypothetical protein PEGG_01763 [Paraeggerthella hongkongensis]|uniref:ABC-2 transporter permease n=1 Tax=Paraeggerthella TaxID=651554 RepID=UPI001C0FE0D2|nr:MULTISPECIES: ABC-2 transporter permease [Paraeggerthella]MBU5405265.1 ABC-2 transporter permease [Paraeggerthella hongkongensis]MCD2433366.1 ABC-2 transporter permease [Paraeggerthella hominis]MDY3982139.1 ABC-2 transporter permease [Paraeggerthella sp.]